MKKLFYLVSVLAFAVQISGCTQNAFARGAEGLANDASAYFKSDNDWSLGGLSTTVVAIYPVVGKPVLEPNSIVDYGKVKVAPGVYGVALRVNYGYGVAYPFVSVDAKPGKTYLFTAKPVMDRAAVRAEYKETNTFD
ncbi:hypothetical protein ACW9IB_07940 [Pseudomonas sp. SDO524_S393]